MWEEEYTARTEYELSDLSSASMIDLANRMAVNDTLFERYMEHWKGVDWAAKFCDPFDICRKDVLCIIENQLLEPLLECMV